MPVPNSFASATTSIPLSQLDQNFNTPITLGNTAIQLGNTVTTLNNMTLANATVSSGNVTVTSASLSGNLTFTGTGNRITGDFSNATVANRVAFQTSTVNGNTTISTIPNGTGTISGFVAYSNSDPTNASSANFAVVAASDARIQSAITGTGTYLPMTFYTGGSEAMRIDTSRNVGIGTSSPGYKLDVQASSAVAARFSNSSTGGAVILSLASSQGIWGAGFDWNGSAFVARDTLSSQVRTDSGIIGFFVNSGLTSGNTFTPTEAARFDTSGNLLVGTTSNNGVITSFTGSASGRAGFFMVNAASSLGSDAVGISKFDNNTTTSQVFVKFFINNNAAASGLITASGANQAAFTSSSDSRLKENIVDLPSQLANIMALRPVEFDYIESEGGGHQIGFIAQEVQEIYPDVVGTREDGMLLVSDFNKNDARLIKAIQELKAELDATKAEVAALKGA